MKRKLINFGYIRFVSVIFPFISTFMSVLVSNLTSFKSGRVRFVIVKLLPEHSVIVSTQFVKFLTTSTD